MREPQPGYLLSVVYTNKSHVLAILPLTLLHYH